MNKKLESGNYYALRAVINFGNSLDYDSILSAVNMQSLEHRWYYQSLVLLFKCIKGNGHDYITDLFESVILHYNLRNSNHNLTQPSNNNRYYHNSFTYKASHLWNHFPSYIKRSWINSDEFDRGLIDLQANQSQLITGLFMSNMYLNCGLDCRLVW